MTNEQLIDLADRLDCIEAERLEDGDALLQASEAIREAARGVKAEREACAKIAEHGCLVPPDGGSPTEAEKEMCDGIAKAIRDRDGHSNTPQGEQS